MHNHTATHRAVVPPKMFFLTGFTTSFHYSNTSGVNEAAWQLLWAVGISSWERARWISLLTKHYKDQISVFSLVWCLDWIQTYILSVNHRASSYTTSLSTVSKTQSHALTNKTARPSVTVQWGGRQTGVFLSHPAPRGWSTLTLYFIRTGVCMLRGCRHSSFAQYVLYPGQEMPNG